MFQDGTKYFNALIMEKWQKYPQKYCFVYL